MEAIKSKIEKLFRLANKTPYPAEAAAAFAKAQGLMEQYKIEQASLHVHGEPKESVRSFENFITGKRLASWKVTLVLHLANANGLHLLKGPNGLSLYGTRSNVDAFSYLHSYCRKEIDRLVAANCSGRGKAYSNDFRFGCVDAIELAIRKEIREKRESLRKAAANNKELMIVDQAIARVDRQLVDAKQYVNERFKTKNSTLSAGRWNDARVRGQEQGRNIYRGRSSTAVGHQAKIGH